MAKEDRPMKNCYEMKLSDRKFGDLYLCFCGYADCSPLHSFGPAVRPNYIIHYILKGRGCYHISNTRYALKAGQGFLIVPDIQTFYQADEKDPWSYLWIGFAGNNAEDYLRDLGLNSSQPVFSCSRGAELKLTILNMLKNNTSTISNQYLLESLLYSFFAILTKDIEIPSGKKESKENRYVRQAIEYIQNNYSNPLHISDIADYVCINRSYLYTLFQQNLGMSVQEYLTNFRLTRATELLVLTELSIEGVAMSCGYKDALVFSKMFKAQTGITPSSYRRNHRQEVKDSLIKNRDRLDELQTLL